MRVQTMKLAFIPLFLVVFSICCTAQIKPYRVLLVIGDQWKDPRSFLVSGGGEFQTMVTLFKSWGIPFDILRLDQTIMDPNQFTDFDGQARYGAILWDVPGNSLSASDQALVADAVEKLHISLIAIGDRVQQPEIQRLLGIRYKGNYMHSSHQIVQGDSFLLRGLGPDLRQTGPNAITMHRVQVELAGAQALANSGGMPEITERQISDDTRAIWIGGDIDQMLLYQQLRTALRRAVTEAIGYAVVKTWTNDIALTMDDMGNAQNAWLEHWHYPALTQEQIEKYMIEPLKAHHAILSLNIVPGFVDDAQHKIVPTWHAQFTDEFGTKQDYVSTKKGLDEGIAAGVLEIESHGWTHMQPDLTSPPGPWWGSGINDERAEIGWYREFYDIRRDKEIPAAEAKFHMQESKDWLKAEFGIDALEFSTGGNGVSEVPTTTRGGSRRKWATVITVDIWGRIWRWKAAPIQMRISVAAMMCRCSYPHSLMVMIAALRMIPRGLPRCLISIPISTSSGWTNTSATSTRTFERRLERLRTILSSRSTTILITAAL